jgi:hypothetical protein
MGAEIQTEELDKMVVQEYMTVMGPKPVVRIGDEQLLHKAR